MNTVFKCYAAGAALLAPAAAAPRAARPRDAAGAVGRPRRDRRWRRPRSSRTRSASSCSGRSAPRTALDGLAWMTAEAPGDRAAVEWIRANAPPGTRIVEAVGGAYSDHGRIGNATGRPILLGWTNHEGLWRGGAAAGEIEDRRRDVETVYRSSDPAAVREVLARRGVRYVVVGRARAEGARETAPRARVRAVRGARSAAPSSRRGPRSGRSCGERRRAGLRAGARSGPGRRSSSSRSACRLWDLGSRAFHHDESIHGWFTFQLAYQGDYKYDPVYHGPVQYFMVAAAFRLLGDSDFSARLPAALGGVGLVAMAMLLRARFGRGAAFASGVLLALSPNLLYFTRFCREDVWSLLGTFGLFLWLDRWWRTRRVADLGLAAVWGAVAFASKENFYVLGALMAPSVLAAVVGAGERASPSSAKVRALPRRPRAARRGDRRRALPLLHALRGGVHVLPRPPRVGEPGLRRDLVLVGPAQGRAGRRAEDLLPAPDPPVRVRDRPPGARLRSPSAGGASARRSASSRRSPSPPSRCTRGSARRRPGSSSTRSSRSSRSPAPRGPRSPPRAPGPLAVGRAGPGGDASLTTLSLSFWNPLLSPSPTRGPSRSSSRRRARS